MNPPCTHTFIHSVRSFSLPLSMAWVLLFRCLLPDCLPDDCLSIVWYVYLTDQMRYWLSTVHLFAFWSTYLSRYHFTDRLVDWMTSVRLVGWFPDVYLFTDPLCLQAGCWLTDMMKAQVQDISSSKRAMIWLSDPVLMAAQAIVNPLPW